MDPPGTVEGSAPSRRRSLIGVSVVVLVLSLVAFIRVGSWLVVADPLTESDAIVVLSGAVPYRAMGGARLYQEGWAPEVWLTRATGIEEYQAMAELGIEQLIDADYNREILEHLGVPADAIRAIPTPVRNTLDEIRATADMLSETGGGSVIIVTSPYHTRRSRALWRRAIGRSPRLSIQPAHEDPFEPARWWRSSSDIALVAKELLGLVNAWLGSPIEPRGTSNLEDT